MDGECYPSPASPKDSKPLGGRTDLVKVLSAAQQVDNIPLSFLYLFPASLICKGSRWRFWSLPPHHKGHS